MDPLIRDVLSTIQGGQIYMIVKWAIREGTNNSGIRDNYYYQYKPNFSQSCILNDSVKCTYSLELKVNKQNVCENFNSIAAKSRMFCRSPFNSLLEVVLVQVLRENCSDDGRGPGNRGGLGSSLGRQLKQNHIFHNLFYFWFRIMLGALNNKHFCGFNKCRSWIQLQSDVHNIWTENISSIFLLNFFHLQNPYN